jgi:hypothetical protein
VSDLAHFVTIDTPIGSVQVLDKDRRSFDVDKLGERTTQEQFDALTKVVVDIDAWDAAVEAGDVKANDIAAVVTPTPYTEVREA